MKRAKSKVPAPHVFWGTTRHKWQIQGWKEEISFFLPTKGGLARKYLRIVSPLSGLLIH
jgi:hypothetical protein